MRRLFIIFAVLFSASAFAAHDFEVETEIDEFTGKRSCSHFVVNSVLDLTGVSLAVSSDLPEVFVYLVRSFDRVSDAVYNMFTVMPSDRVYIRFPGTEEVIEVTPKVTSVESSYEVAAFVDTALAHKIMASPTDLRVRFAGSNGNADFTVNHDVVVGLADGFGKDCL